MLKILLKKEFLLIFRDIHAIAVLFLMPAAFILIMSLALKNSYSNEYDTKLKVALLTIDDENAKNLKLYIDANKRFSATIIDKYDLNIKELIYKEHYDFVVTLTQDYKNKIKDNKTDISIIINSNPNIMPQENLILKNLIIEILSRDVMKDFFIKYRLNGKTLSELDKYIFINNVYKNEKPKLKPTSVQYSVPSWLVFSIFFILIPISNTFINEKNYGTISRLKSIDLSMFLIIFAKIVPYYIINQIQVIIMILIGMYVIPIFNGDALHIEGNIGLIFLMSSAISIAAISFAILIANISKTTEQATTIGGVSNIILAALGGIMVPKFVMPQVMQDITIYSPMNWGLEGLLEIFVTGGEFRDISIYFTYLLIFATICLIISYILLNRRKNVL